AVHAGRRLARAAGADAARAVARRDARLAVAALLARAAAIDVGLVAVELAVGAVRRRREIDAREIGRAGEVAVEKRKVEDAAVAAGLGGAAGGREREGQGEEFVAHGA